MTIKKIYKLCAVAKKVKLSLCLTNHNAMKTSCT